jgi:hypothetical protein
MLRDATGHLSNSNEFDSAIARIPSHRRNCTFLGKVADKLNKASLVAFPGMARFAETGDAIWRIG